MDKGSFGFSLEDAMRIGGSVQVTERLSKNPPVPGRVARAWQGGGVIPAKLIGTILSGSPATPSKGSCMLYIGGTSGAGLVTGDTEDVYNILAQGITGPKTIWCTYFNGLIYIVNADC